MCMFLGKCVILSKLWVQYKSDDCTLAEEKTDSTKELGSKMTDKFILQSCGCFLLYSKVYIKCLNIWLTGHICIVS
jgi:hypothetical protein